MGLQLLTICRLEPSRALMLWIIFGLVLKMLAESL